MTTLGHTTAGLRLAAQVVWVDLCVDRLSLRQHDATTATQIPLRSLGGHGIYTRTNSIVVAFVLRQLRQPRYIDTLLQREPHEIFLLRRFVF